VAAGLHNIGFVYHEKRDYVNALKYYLRSLQVAEKLGDIYAIINHYNQIADCYVNMKMFHAALKYASLAMEMSRTFNMRPAIRESYEMLYQIEQAQGNFKSALAYHEVFKAYSDSLANEATESEQQRLESQYILEKSEKERLMSSREAEISSIRHEEKEKEITQYILIIGLVLLLFVVGVYVVFVLFRKSKFS
jgi:tetratricopeptide (TPR) repeat protein